MYVFIKFCLRTQIKVVLYFIWKQRINTDPNSSTFSHLTSKSRISQVFLPVHRINNPSLKTRSRTNGIPRKGWLLNPPKFVLVLVTRIISVTFTIDTTYYTSGGKGFISFVVTK